jgi:hypothetical protein
MKHKIVLWLMIVIGLALSIVLILSLELGRPVGAQGGMFFRGRVAVDGLADEIQLRVQGWTTQTNSLFVAENSGGTDLFTVSGAGNVVISGTTDLAGSVSSSMGGITITDSVMVDGAVDTVQLTIQGFTTQTVNALVVEQSDGTDVFEVDDNGHITATTFTLDSVALSGPVTFGSDTATTHGELIAHGLGTTPTAVLLTPISATLSLTHTVAVAASNATSFTVGITPTAASNNIGIYWMAGK